MNKVAYSGQAYKPGNPTADTLFRQGKSTLEIAQHFGVSEAKVLRRINRQRSKRLGKPSPYQSKE